MASGRLGLLQIVLEPDTTRCANEEAEPRREVDMRWCASKGRWASKWGGFVRSHISWGGERNIVYKGVETSS